MHKTPNSQMNKKKQPMAEKTSKHICSNNLDTTQLPMPQLVVLVLRLGSFDAKLNSTPTMQATSDWQDVGTKLILSYTIDTKYDHK